eukprot:3245060-Alexandrium_andersonii.AAC.1
MSLCAVGSIPMSLLASVVCAPLPSSSVPDALPIWLRLCPRPTGRPGSWLMGPTPLPASRAGPSKAVLSRMWCFSILRPW